MTSKIYEVNITTEATNSIFNRAAIVVSEDAQKALELALNHWELKWPINIRQDDNHVIIDHIGYAENDYKPNRVISSDVTSLSAENEEDAALIAKEFRRSKWEKSRGDDYQERLSKLVKLLKK